MSVCPAAEATRTNGTGLHREVETQLAQDILRLFAKYHLTAPQAKSLLEKVRVLVEAGEMGLFNTQH
jgi:hypothetical protein